jgi:hypothetical protein
VQKAAFFLEEAAGVPLGLEFVLYKHGPFSFELRDELVALRAERLLSLRPASPPYGPQLVATPAGQKLLEDFPKTLAKYGGAVEEIATFVGNRGVISLERLATALYLLPQETDDAAVATDVVAVKPHIRYDDALQAVMEVRELLRSIARSTTGVTHH